MVPRAAGGGWWVSVCAAPVCSLRLHPQRAAAVSRQPPAAARIINNTLVPLCTFPSPLCRHLSWNQAWMQSARRCTSSICCTDYAFVLFTVISYASLPYLLPISNTSAFDLVSRNLHKLKLAFGLFTLNYEE